MELEAGHRLRRVVGAVEEAGALEHRNAVSAYDGQRLTGVVRRTWLRGVPTTGEPAGRLLSRTES